MFPQMVAFPQIYPGEGSNYVFDLATGCFMPTHGDHVLMGEIAYEFLARETNTPSGQRVSDYSGYTLLSEGTNHFMDPVFPTPGSAGYITFPSTTNSPLFPLSPSPSPSQDPSGSPEHHQTSPEPENTPEPSCRNGTPVFNPIRRKWCCSVCGKDFRGKWECGRHIESADRRAECLACGANLKVRGDSLKRHFQKYCKKDIGDPRLEDAFVEV
ncbi:hypothetical protein BJ322DRAFT_146824 [Thelephora terrestris]|uniref:C2H2-type domain-containing protein n=1 Tax=Thelephora terrestris TaxID=56493 RepID=A0A9P6L5B6_9AGAM|nr:hypothetical protein BJ322DRAFT_146824 [Thelephora terrestris]